MDEPNGDEFDEISVIVDSDEECEEPRSPVYKERRTPLKEILQNRLPFFKDKNKSPTRTATPVNLFKHIEKTKKAFEARISDNKKKCKTIIKNAFKNKLTQFSYDHPFYEAFMLHRQLFIDALLDYLKKNPINDSEKKCWC